MSGYPGAGYPGAPRPSYPGAPAAGYPGGAGGYPGAPGAPPAGYPGAGAPPAGYPGAGAPPAGYPGAPGAPPGGGYRGPPGAPAGGYPGGPGAPGGAPAGYPGSGAPAGYPGGPAGGYQGGPQQVGGVPVTQVDPQVAQWFQAVDQDNSGHIDAKELGQALANGDMSKFSEEACQLMITMFDSNLTGTIDINEFGKLFAYINQWKGTFEKYDRDRSGVIDQGEFSQALQEMGYRSDIILLDRLCPVAAVVTDIRILFPCFTGLTVSISVDTT